jgi:hypothetical protein
MKHKTGVEIDIEEEFKKHAVDGIITYKKGETHETVIRHITNATEAYNTIPELVGVTVLGVEEKLQDRILGLPIELKCYADFVYRTSEGTVINVDYKTVDKFSSGASASYQIQGWINMLLTAEVYGEVPTHMEFIELKKTKNRDKTLPVSRHVRVEFPTKIEQYILYQLIIRIWQELNGENLIQAGIPLPNPYDTMNGKASWEHFILSCTMNETSNE